MTDAEWEQHPVFALFVASVLEQLLDAAGHHRVAGVLTASVALGRSIYTPGEVEVLS